MNAILGFATVLLIYFLVRTIRRREVGMDVLRPLSLAPMLVLELLLFYGMLYGALGLDYGVAAQFFHDEWPVQFAAGMAGALFLGLVSACLTLLAGRYTPFGLDLAGVAPGHLSTGLFVRFLGRQVGYLVPLLILALVPTIPGALPEHPSLSGVGRWAWPLGLGAGTATFAGLMFLISATVSWSRLTGRSARYARQAMARRRGQSADEVLAPEAEPEPLMIAHWEGDALLATTALGLALVYVLMAGVRPLGETLSPAVAGCLVLALFAVVYSLVVYRHPVNQVPVFVIIFLIVSFTNGLSWDTVLPEFKYQFPGLTAYYERAPKAMPTQYHVLNSERYQEAHVGEGARSSGLLDNTSVLDNWLRRCGFEPDAHPDGSGRELPKLAIVTVSGGGIRAATWTAEVLTELERALGKRGVAFPRHVRLLTGASGGMVGAASYVVSLGPPTDTVGDSGRPDPQLDRIVASVAESSLGPVFRTMLFRDLPSALIPMSTGVDRGVALEASWEESYARHVRSDGTTGGSRLSRPIRELKPGESQGWLPSLVFTPMFVEDGRRLLISNLDLSLVTRNHTRRLNPPIFAKPKGGEATPTVATLSTDGLTSFSGVEFFRLFPDAGAFRVSTAARMSATFPYISPAVSLPTRPPRRVVDAGYYDNYGVNLASMWILEFRTWLMRNTSGVVLIEIRDHEGQKSRLELNPGPESAAPTAGHAFRLGATALLSPLTGLLSARSASMTYRNDEQLEWLGVYLPRGIDDREGGIPLLTGRADYDPQTRRADDFFISVVFEAPEGVSLSWSLTRLERAMLSAAIDSRDAPRTEVIRNPALLEKVEHVREENRERLDLLLRWWLK